MKKLILIVLTFLICQTASAEVAVTIYNNDLGLVRDLRNLTFPEGIGEIRFSDVAERIIPTSVHFYSERAELLEQNYEYDLVDARKILKKYVDQRIHLFTEGDGSFVGTLLAASGDIVLKEDDNSIRVLSVSKIYNYHFPTSPEGLITKPTLVWTVQSSKGGPGEGEVSYLTEGISWAAEYIAVTNADDKALGFTGWVNIENNCGASFKDAKLKLIAGDVQILKENRHKGRQIYAMDAAVTMEGARSFEEESLFEYHLYTLQRKSTILNNQIKQISLFPEAEVGKVEKEYRFDYGKWQNKINVSLSFDNTKVNNLNIPLPRGKVRVYKASSTGDLEFIGEDRIDHTARKEKVKVSTGKAFDVVGERTVINEKRRGNDRQSEVEIKIRNRKKESVEVIVSEEIWGDWTMLEATGGWNKVSSNRVEWKVIVRPDEEKIINYHVQKH